MRTIGFSLLLFATIAAPAQGGPLGFGGFGPHHGGFGWRLGFGGFYSSDFAQSRFEDKLEDLMTEYDEGLAEIDDYFNSDEYDEVVDDTERLSDRYTLFLDGVELKIDWLDLSISHLTDESEFLDELLTKYTDDEDLSAERLERLTNWITSFQDLITLKIDYLTEKQTTLSENLTTFTAFGEDITTFLDTVVAAGGGEDTEETDTTATALALSSISATTTSPVAAMSSISEESCVTDEVLDSEPVAISIIAVPEPAVLALVALTLVALVPRRFVRLERRPA